jgi:hypothetical protein
MSARLVPVKPLPARNVTLGFRQAVPFWHSRCKPVGLPCDLLRQHVRNARDITLQFLDQPSEGRCRAQARCAIVVLFGNAPVAMMK